jgi:hypothetical protein
MPSLPKNKSSKNVCLENIHTTVQCIMTSRTELTVFISNDVYGWKEREMTEVFPCIFLSCKANARVKLVKTGHGPHSSTLVVICVVPLLYVLFRCHLCCSMYCLCVNVYCHRVTTQLQLTNISI